MKLTHPNSPLARQARHNTVRTWPGENRQLSPADQDILDRILTQKYEYVPSDIFDLSETEADKQIFEKAPEIKEPDISWYHPVIDSLAEIRMNKKVSNLLLTSKQEKALFLQYNYCRYHVCRLRDELLPKSRLPYHKTRRMLDWHDRAEHYREKIAQTNLALVLAMAKRCRIPISRDTIGIDFADLVSEGNMALLRAVDKFDVARGYKFSTYACRAILKAFSRASVKISRYRQLFPTDFDPSMEKSDHVETRRAEHKDDCVDEVKQIIRDNRAELSHVEKEVIEHRFAIFPDAEKNNGSEQSRTLTLEQVGRIIGVTKERVRQIQNKALEKIRITLETEFLT